MTEKKRKRPEEYMSCQEYLENIKREIATENGLITGKQFNGIPPYVEYSLTEMGRELLPVFDAIMRWGFTYDKELHGDTECR